MEKTVAGTLSWHHEVVLLNDNEREPVEVRPVHGEECLLAAFDVDFQDALGVSDERAADLEQVAQVGAEPFTEAMRRELFDAHGIMARQGFGTADTEMLAYECAEASGMHLLEDAITQVCDPTTGEPLPNGQIGELVATVHNRTYPMIRFSSGDLTVITDEPCPCGRTSARMLGWRGRADEVTKVRGIFVHPRQVDEPPAARVTPQLGVVPGDEQVAVGALDDAGRVIVLRVQREDQLRPQGRDRVGEHEAGQEPEGRGGHDRFLPGWASILSK